MPAATVPLGVGFTGASNAFACNGSVAQVTGNNRSQHYLFYGFALPSTATVDGIEVRVRANDGTKNNRALEVSLSWDGGVSFTAAQATPPLQRMHR